MIRKLVPCGVAFLGLGHLFLVLTAPATAAPPMLSNPLVDPPALMLQTGEQMVDVSIQVSDQDGDLDVIKVKHVRGGQKNELLAILTLDQSSVGQFRTPTYTGNILIDTDLARTITLRFVAKDRLKSKNRIDVPLPVIEASSSWVHIGPNSGKINAIAIDPSNPTTLYAALPSGVYKSIDGATTWEQVGTDAIARPVISLAVDPDVSSTLYAGVQNVKSCTLCGPVGGDMFKSDNGGTNWNASESALENIDVFSIAINPQNPNTLYVAAFSRGVFRSTDSGKNWTPSPTQTAGESLVIDPISPTTIYAASREGVFKSVDAGDTWSVSDTGLELNDIHEVSIAIDPDTPTTLYVSTSFGLFKSIDAGVTWNVIQATHSMNAVAVDPLRPSTVYAGTWFDGVFKSVDAGETWEESNNGLSTTRVRVLTVDPVTPTIVYAGTLNSGIYKSGNEGETWTPHSAGLPSPDVRDIAVDPVNPMTLYIGTNGEGVFKSVDGGNTWESTTTGLSTLFINGLVIDPVTPTTLYAGTNIGGFKTEDEGATWTAMNVAGFSVSTTILAVDPATPSIVYGSASNGGMFKSMDGGGTWSQIETTGLSSNHMNVLVVDSSTPSTLYGSSAQGGVFRSTDSGTSWSSLGFDGRMITSLVPDPTSPGMLYVGIGSGGGLNPEFRAGVFKSMDGGETWVPKDSGLPIPDEPLSFFTITLVVDPIDSSILYAGTGGRGIFQSGNGGTIWEPTVGISGTVNAFAVNPLQPTFVYAATDRGVFTVDRALTQAE